jgi:hypothetical protein
MIPADTTEIVEFTLDSEKDLPEDKKAVFKVRPITVRGMRMITRMTKDPDTNVSFRIDQTLDLLNLHITGWRNVFHPSGEPIGFEIDNRGYSIETNWDNFALPRIVEIFQRMIKAMGISGDEAKN